MLLPSVTWPKACLCLCRLRSDIYKSCVCKYDVFHLKSVIVKACRTSGADTDARQPRSPQGSSPVKRPSTEVATSPLPTRRRSSAMSPFGEIDYNAHTPPKPPLPRRRSLAVRPFAEVQRSEIKCVTHVSDYVRV